MALKPFKFVVQAVVVEVDDAENIVAERPGDVLTFYGVQQLAEFADAFVANLENATVTDEPAP